MVSKHGGRKRWKRNVYWEEVDGFGRWKPHHQNWESDLESELYQVKINAHLWWRADYRPGFVRIYYHGGPVCVEITDQDDNVIASVGDVDDYSYVSGADINLNFTADKDIKQIVIKADEHFVVNPIDFVGQYTSTTTSTTTTTTTTESGPDEFFDDNYWTPVFGEATWNDPEWDSTYDAFLGIIQVINLQPTGGWETGYDPSNLEITLSNIASGSSTFNLTVQFEADGGQDVVENAVALSNDTPYEMDLSSGGSEPSRLIIQQDGDIDETFSLTNLRFNV